MRALIEAKIDWDETIPELLQVQWQRLVSALEESQPTTIPRCYLDGVEGKVSSYISSLWLL